VTQIKGHPKGCEKMGGKNGLGKMACKKTRKA
jgi:hypothetical protein